MKTDAPNPAGKAGKPFTLAPMKFDDALRKILQPSPEPEPERKPTKKKPTKRKNREQ